MKILGVCLVILGIIGLVYGGVSWTHKDTVVDAGPIEITRDETERLPLPPIAGGVLLAAGVILLVSRRGAR
jgi:hypothetical protein